jgi:hypothetical protein
VTFSDFFSGFSRTKTLSAGNALSRGNRGYQKIHWLSLSLLLLSPALMAQKTMPGINAGFTPTVPESPVKFESIPYVSGNQRDPFLNPQSIRKSAPKGDEEISRGLPPPGIAGTSIAQAVPEGISVSKDKHIAVIRGADSRRYFLKEGDRLFDGYIKSILDDSIIFVRETKMRSGKIMTQDVTKRLRTQ